MGGGVTRAEAAAAVRDGGVRVAVDLQDVDPLRRRAGVAAAQEGDGRVVEGGAGDAEDA